MKLTRVEESTAVAETAKRYKRKRHKRHRPKKLRYVLAGVCLFLVICGIALPIFGYPAFESRYQQDFALAQTGAQELQTAAAQLQTTLHDPLNSVTVDRARHDFSLASATFTRLNSDLTLVPDALIPIPSYGTRLHAAKHLVPLAIDVAQAGLAACTSLSTIASSFHDPLKKAQGLSMADLAALNQSLRQIKMALDQAMAQVSQLRPGDLQVDPRLGKIVSEFHSRLPLLQQGINQAEAFMATAPLLLGINKPAHYLVEILDSTELRPGGGFIGNYSIVSLSGGRLASAQVIDTYLLDRGFGHTYHTSFPPAYSWFTVLTKTWGLRDSNLDADFPTSARNGEMLYKLEGGKLPLAGVVAVTPALIERILTLSGPIVVPEYHETVTAQNLIERIHYHQIIEDAKGGDVPSADGDSSVRKHFTALLGEAFAARLHTLPSSIFPKVLQVVIDSMQTKDMQIYLNADEKALRFYHIDDAIQSSVSDGIFVVDANIHQNKANRYLVTTLDDQVTIDQSGTATHHTLIKFTWTRPRLKGSDFYGPTLYKDYVRVYMPSNSILLKQAGWIPKDTGIAFGRKFWGGYSSINYPQTGTITLTWSAAGAAQKEAHGWRYLYLVQHQAGAQQEMYIKVGLASCAAIVDKSTGVVEDNKQFAYLAQALTRDTEMSIDYTC